MKAVRWGRVLDRTFWISVVLFGLWGVGLLVFLYGWIPHYVRGETVVVPDFRGRPASEVEVRVRQLGMRIEYEATEERFDSRVPAGHVLAQVPVRVSGSRSPGRSAL
ncbi:MAG: hypothetical protein KatS3mg115_1981 [Candidatus Poribacteria bacterium]|nr:MAG: hypothetical protein KatS3mg115_1981 [Candidatus Poribacteria bacterium]